MFSARAASCLDKATLVCLWASFFCSQATRQDAEHYECYEADGPLPVAAPRLGLAAGHDELGLQRRGLALLARIDLSQPPFRIVEVAAAQEPARVVPSLSPLPGADQQAGVVADPVQIHIERGQELGHPALERVGIADVDPVELGQGTRHAVGVHLPGDDGDQPLVLEGGVLDLFPADLGLDGVGAEDEHHGLRGVDRPADLLHPFLGGQDAASPPTPCGRVPRAHCAACARTVDRRASS